MALQLGVATAALVLLFGACSALAGCSGAQPTPGEVAERTARTTATVLRCQAEGRDAGHFAAYDACMADAGLR